MSCTETRLALVYAVFLVVVMVLSAVYSLQHPEHTEIAPVEVVVENAVEVSRPPTIVRLARVSAYNAVPRQTDDDPATASCGKTIPNSVALSRDLFFDANGHKFRCGQIVSVVTDRGEIFENLVVWDTMHSRFSSTADILWPNDDEGEAYEFGITGGWLIINP